MCDTKINLAQHGFDLKSQYMVLFQTKIAQLKLQFPPDKYLF